MAIRLGPLLRPARRFAASNLVAFAAGDQSSRTSRTAVALLARPGLLIFLSALVLLLPAPPGDVVPAYERARAGVPPLAAGVHAPNRPWRDADFVRVAQGQFGAVKMMSYHPLESYARLRQELPHVQFVVRLDTPWNELPPPDQFAGRNAPYLRSLVQAGYEPWVEIGNEPNLELHPDAAAAFVAWYGEVLDRLRAAVPEARYGFPGLAQDRQESAWLAAAAPAIERSDWLGVHAYWHNAREMLDPKHALWLVRVHQQFPALPLLVTEAGNDAPAATAAQRAEEYARFTRTLARLPYVRAVDFFILSGTPEWQRFFFNDQMTAALRSASRDPVPVLDGLAAGLQAGKQAAQAAGRRLLAARRSGAKQQAPPARVAPAPAAAPTPLPFGRRRLLADLAPDAARSDRWLPRCARAGDPAAPAALPASGPASDDNPVPARATGGTAPGSAGETLAGPAGRPPPCALRTASAYLATDFSARLDLPAPALEVPALVAIAQPGLMAVAGFESAAGDGADATGFVVLWDGAQWRLQYRQDGVVASDQTFQVAGGEAGGWYQLELALEKRSAAAWVWRRGTTQPAQPNAVFAPPETAALDGARPRVLFIPVAAQNVVLEGATRD